MNDTPEKKREREGDKERERECVSVSSTEITTKKMNDTPQNPEYQIALATKYNTLGRLLRRILPKHCLRERAKLQKCVEMTAIGEPWKDIERKTGVAWLQINVLLRRYSEFQELWHSARDAGEDRRKEIRESEAHRRAVDGWMEPVFYKGEKCGNVTKFSDKLHELLLKSDNPEKYSDLQKVEHTGSGPGSGGITVVFQDVSFGRQPKNVEIIGEINDLLQDQSKKPDILTQGSPENNELQANVEGNSETSPQPKIDKNEKKLKK